MICAKCAHESPPESRYCEQCGKNFDAGFEAAGFWPRFLGRIIDVVLIDAATFATIFLFAFLEGLISGRRELQSQPAYFIIILIFVIYTVIYWLYDALLESSEKQATVGKMALGLIVIDENGNRLSFGRATGRHFAKLFLGSIFAVGYLFIPFTKNHQGLYDMLVGTFVIWKKRDVSTIPQSPTV